MIRMSYNHRYKTSRDYSKLYRLASETPVICIVNNHHPSIRCRDIACSKVNFCSDGSRVTEISCRGTSYVYANNEQEFVKQCEFNDVEFLDPEEIPHE